MLKIGFVDDENINHADYATRLKRKGVELKLYEGNGTAQSIAEWIIQENLSCMLVDYDLSKKYTRNGTDLVFAINQLLPNFPCIMLTNYPEQSGGEKLVPTRLIWDREKMNALDLTEVVEVFKNEAEVYQKRKETLLTQYEELIEKRNHEALTATEEEQLLFLHSLFSKYGETDDFPAQLLSTETNQKLDSIIEQLTRLIDTKGE